MFQAKQITGAKFSLPTTMDLCNVHFLGTTLFILTATGMDLLFIEHK